MARKRRRTHVPPDENALKRVPRSLVFKQGPGITKAVADLSRDLRLVFMPWTAINLKERKNASLKDYVHVGGVLHISHMMVLTQKADKVFLDYCRSKAGKGPTIYFEVLSYALAHDVRTNQECPRTSQADYVTVPIMVTSGFQSVAPTTESEQLAATGVAAAEPVTAEALAQVKHVISTALPAISRDVHGAKTKRVVLFAHIGSGVVELRQYAITGDREKILGTAKPLRRRGPKHEVKPEVKPEVKQEVLDEDDKRAIVANEVKLIELGPRVTLKLLGVRDGVFPAGGLKAKQ